MIAGGGRFQVRDLHSDKTSTVMFESSTGLIEFISAENITQGVGKLYVTKSKTHTAIDFVSWTASALQLFNSTTNTKHEVVIDSADSKSGMFRFVSRLPVGYCRKEYYFAVSQERFLEMCYPQLRWKESYPNITVPVKRPLKVEKQECQNTFKFYAICIPTGKRSRSTLRLIV